MEKSQPNITELLQFWKGQATQRGGNSYGTKKLPDSVHSGRQERHEGKKLPDILRQRPGPQCTQSRVSLKREKTVEPRKTGVFSGSDESGSLVPSKIRENNTKISQEITEEPGLGDLSLKSDQVINPHAGFKTGYQASDEIDAQVGPGLHKDQQPQSNFTLELLRSKLFSYLEKEWLRLQRILKPLGRQSPQDEEEDEEEAMRGSREAFLKIIEKLLLSMKQDTLAESIWKKRHSATSDVQRSLQRKFRYVIDKEQKTTHPFDIYSELLMTERSTDQINEEHEVRQVEVAAGKLTGQEKSIHDLLKSQRRLLTLGVAGIGKTVLTQKVTLDWAEDKAHQNFDFIFPFTFRELNLLKQKELSLLQLIHHYFPETKKIKATSLEEFEILFIFDGLDESLLPVNFNNTQVLTKVTEPASLDVLLTNLIRRKLLPKARLWITTRPVAANQIPCVNMVTEIRGFNDIQMKDYLRKLSRDEKQTSTIISHIKASPRLNMLCHIPIVCSITATVLEDMVKGKETVQLPKTLTEMFIHYLVGDRGSKKDPHWTHVNKKKIKSLGKLAFHQRQKKKFYDIYESDLTECGIKVTEAEHYSRVFSNIFKRGERYSQDTVFCFVHLSLRDFLAALYVHMKFSKYGVNLMQGKPAAAYGYILKHEEFYQSALNEPWMSQNRHPDMFLQSILGLSVKSNQCLLKGLSVDTGSSWTSQKGADLVKEKIKTAASLERMINLFYCLNELQENSLVEEVQQMLGSGNFSTITLTSSHWSALTFMLLTSQETLFDLYKYGASEKAFLKLLPVIQASNKVLLRCCGLSTNSCQALSLVFRTPPSNLTELDLSNNDLKDCGVKLLCEGLKSPGCDLKTLRLGLCGLSKESCAHLSSVLSSPSSHLKNLDLSDNDLKDAGVKILSAGLKSLHCHLETLSLSGCLVTEMGCASLASALASNPFHLRELDLSWNHPEGSGLDLLSRGLENPDWKLNTLRTMQGDEQRLTPGLRKYFCQFTLNPITAHQRLRLTNNNKTVDLMTEDQNHPFSPDRFKSLTQLMCDNSLAGHHYWEVDLQGDVLIAVTYRQHRATEELEFGQNSWSWSLRCVDGVSYEIRHKEMKQSIAFRSVCDRVGVYVDWSSGMLSFYRVTNDTLIHIHTIYTTFSQPIYPAFGLKHHPGSGSSMTLSGLDEYSLV